MAILGVGVTGIVYRPYPVYPPSTTTTTTSSTTTTTTPGAPVSYLTPVASLMPDSIFNQPVTSWSVASSSASWVSNFTTGCAANYGCIGVSTQPGYWVPSSQGNVGFTCTNGCAGTGAGQIATSIPIPYSIVALNGSGDNPLDIWQTGGAVDEIWQAVNGGSGTWSGTFGGGAPLSTFTGVFANGYGRTATSISDVATMVTEADVYHGAIDHALSINLTDCDGWTAPATRGDGSCTFSGAAPLGTWWRFSSSVNCPSYNANPFEEMVCYAVQTYGMVSVDYAGAYQINSEQASDWAAEGYSGTDPITASWDGDAEYSVLEGLPWSQLQALVYP
jgi:hypothetical protein